MLFQAGRRVETSVPLVEKDEVIHRVVALALEEEPRVQWSTFVRRKGVGFRKWKDRGRIND